MAYVDSYIIRALQALVSNPSFSMNGDDYDQIIWNDVRTKPTKDAVIAAIKVIRVADAKKNKHQEVTDWKNTQFNTDINVQVGLKSYPFARDYYSKISMNFALQNSNALVLGIDWVTSDGNVIKMNSTNFSALVTAISNSDTAIVTRGFRMKKYINNFPVDMSKVEETIAAINAINILDIN